MGTTVKLYYVDRNSTYKEWELIPNKILVVENIADYLATKSAYTIENFQYQKNALELGINVDISQIYSQPNATTSFKYVSIQNAGENICYYFVKKTIWRSKTTVRFELVMDVLNTYHEGYDYEWKANTKITREHKDRFTFTKAMNVSIEFTDPNVYGSISVNDEVDLVNDHGDTVLTGKVISITADNIYISINNPTNEADYRHYIDSFVEDPFEINKNGANYILFMVTDEREFNFETIYDYYRKIDYVPEGINPILIQKSSNNIEATSILNQNWYLLYRNTNDPDPNEYVNPVECYLIPENETKTDSAYISGGRLIPSWCESDKFYVFKLDTGQKVTLSNGFVFTHDINFYEYMVVSKQINKLNVTFYRSGGTSLIILNEFNNIEYLSFLSLPCMYAIWNDFSSITYTSFISGSYSHAFNNSGDANTIDPITNLDRADAKNIKLIKLPYCPYGLTYWGDTLEIDGSTQWERAPFTQSQGGDFFALHLINNSIKLQNEITANFYNPFTNLKTSLNPSLTNLRVDMPDSKLFHSAFYGANYVYDSFAIHVDLEKCDLNYYITHGITTNKIKFTMTSTINSKFMFTLANYVCNKQEVNFYNVLPVARNNEIVLYNVPYINFIKTGYNYEIKAKNVQNVSNALGLGLSGVSMGVALAVPTAPLKAVAVVGALVSMALSIKNTIVSTMQSEENIKQKLTQYQNQAASVVGSDDVDLMSEYCDNRLKYMIYEPTDVMKNLLNDLFFYAGYSSNRMGIPSHHTRVNFDYLECDASIQAVATIPEECLGELINCFKNGVTYLHKTDRVSDKWDFEQKYENWELSLLED